MHVIPKVQSIILFRSLEPTRNLKISLIPDPQVREFEILAIGFLNLRIGLHFRNPFDTLTKAVANSAIASSTDSRNLQFLKKKILKALFFSTKLCSPKIAVFSSSETTEIIGGHL